MESMKEDIILMLYGLVFGILIVIINLMILRYTLCRMVMNIMILVTMSAVSKTKFEN